MAGSGGSRLVGGSDSLLAAAPHGRQRTAMPQTVARERRGTDRHCQPASTRRLDTLLIERRLTGGGAGAEMWVAARQRLGQTVSQQWEAKRRGGIKRPTLSSAATRRCCSSSLTRV